MSGIGKLRTTLRRGDWIISFAMRLWNFTRGRRSHFPQMKSRATHSVVEGNSVIWFWIGNHHEYEQLLKSR
jgi:hypothetical protein